MLANIIPFIALLSYVQAAADPIKLDPPVQLEFASSYQDLTTGYYWADYSPQFHVLSSKNHTQGAYILGHLTFNSTNESLHRQILWGDQHWKEDGHELTTCEIWLTGDPHTTSLTFDLSSKELGGISKISPDYGLVHFDCDDGFKLGATYLTTLPVASPSNNA